MSPFRLIFLFLAALIAGFPGPLAGAEQVTIEVSDRRPGRTVSRYLTGACLEDVNHEIYGGLYSQMIFGESFQEPPRSKNAAIGAAPAHPPVTADQPDSISGMWHGVQIGTAQRKTALETTHPFTGTQSQQIQFVSGQGEVGIENQGLNRWGLCFVQGKPYEGYLWVRTDTPTQLYVSLESRDGSRRYADAALQTSKADGWQRLDFTLTPSQNDTSGRFQILLREAGAVVLGHAFLQPGAWARFKNLPVRRDVAQGLIDQGITVLRYGGSMVNSPEYRWKKMIGPRDRRPVYRGTWYPYSTNGWGIFDFLDFCEAAGFLGVPDFNMDETPQDMSDLIEYVNGPADSEWGRRRAGDGHPAPYELRYLELGNEERIDEQYAGKFEGLARAIWAKDPNIILVVGDFAYSRPVADPMHLAGAASKITTMNGHREILKAAKAAGREVWFDVHVWTEGPRPSTDLTTLPTYIDALEKISDGARHHVVVFELNSGNHAQRRALANAWAIDEAIADGRIPIMTSANCLQPDRQNDNDWNQGLLFLNPSQVWLQPPGYVTQMIEHAYEPLALETKVSAGEDVKAVAARSEDGRTLVLQIINLSDHPVPVRIKLDGYVPSRSAAAVRTLEGKLDDVNTAESPKQITPHDSTWELPLEHQFRDGSASYTLPASSFSVIRFD